MLNTSTNNKDDFVVEIMIVMGKDKEIVNDDDHPIKEIFKDIDHGLMEAETSNGNGPMVLQWKACEKCAP